MSRKKKFLRVVSPVQAPVEDITPRTKFYLRFMEKKELPRPNTIEIKGRSRRYEKMTESLAK